MRKLLLFIPLISIATVVLGQMNLVPNGDFEEYWSIPDGLLKESDLSQHLLSWLSPTAGSPDYIHYNSTNAENSVPYQIFQVNSTDYYRNYQLPQSGRGFIGIAAGISSFYEQGLVCESVQTKLKSKLIKNHKYALKFHTARLGYSDFSLHTAGVKLTVDSIRQYLPFTNPHYMNFDTAYTADYYVDSIVYNDTTWHQNESILKAKGDEEWLTFGNFGKKNDYLKYLGQPKLLRTYFFVDNISLTETPCLVGPETVCEGEYVKLYSTFKGKFEWSLDNKFATIFSTDSIVSLFANKTKKIFLRSPGGIDSLMLQVIPKSYSETNVVSCFDFTSPSGNIHSSSGTYYDTISNHLGCDSIIISHFTLNTANASISLTDRILSTNETLNVAEYQWTTCNQESIPLPDATRRFFTPAKDGWYSLVINQNDCTDTSECVYVNTPRLSDNISIRPNPTFGDLNIVLGYTFNEISYQIYNPIGELIETKNLLKVKTFRIDMAQYAAGVYFIRVRDKDDIISEQILKIR